ncbi:hypothetical protein [Parasitella parasitica]|uniref:Uncharacterized protein n=1 Tax=Parasitella parasitica TaxID=35722 RepID=A0A0B7N6P8_9FUNG|nr:hypothetical protein [Parasitella parasitica]
MSSYFPKICSLLTKTEAKKSNNQDSNGKTQSIRPRSSNSSMTVVTCGYDKLYYDEDASVRPDSNIINSDGTDSGYCVIDNFRSLSFEKLASVYGLPESFSGDDQDVMTEFSFLLAQIKQICHQLDDCRGAVQFGQTDVAIGQKLKEITLFICSRYHEDQNVGDSGIAFLALLMLGNQVFSVPNEVKQQLLYQTKIGRFITLKMLTVLENPKNQADTPRLFFDQTGFIRILYGCPSADTPQRIPEMIDLLTAISEKFAAADKEWDQAANYTTIVKLANDLFSY